MSADVQELPDDTLIALSRAHAEEIHRTSGRRRSAPVRSVFVRDLSGQRSAPLAGLLGIRGRGGEVPLMLYVALLWRSAAAPFSTSIPARKWAELLALPDPAHRGARRVAHALKTLQTLRLIDVKERPGEASLITLLHESGTGSAYFPPRGMEPDDRYFHIPAELWLSGKLQQLSAPAISMLLAVLVDVDTKQPDEPVWWSTTVFPKRFGISASSRSRGTRELVSAGLIRIKRVPIPTNKNRNSFSEERVRNLYYPAGEAVMPQAPIATNDRSNSSRARTS